MSDFVNTVDIVGDEALTDSMIDKTITEIADNVSDEIADLAFIGCDALVTANFPAVTSIGKQAFSGCDALASVNFSALSKVASSSIFENCTALTSVNFPALSTVSSDGIFKYCTALTSVNFPALSKVAKYMFMGCTALTTADFNVATEIVGDSYSGAFRGCTALTSLILRSPTLCSLTGAYAFERADKFTSGTGYIYVPRALVDSYKTASNWSTYANQFRALEDYTVDGTITGALDSTKI